MLFYDHFHLKKDFKNICNYNKFTSLIQSMSTAHSEDEYNLNYQKAVDIVKSSDFGLSWIEEFYKKGFFLFI